MPQPQLQVILGPIQMVLPQELQVEAMEPMEACRISIPQELAPAGSREVQRRRTQAVVIAHSTEVDFPVVFLVGTVAQMGKTVALFVRVCPVDSVVEEVLLVRVQLQDPVVVEATPVAVSVMIAAPPMVVEEAPTTRETTRAIRGPTTAVMEP